MTSIVPDQDLEQSYDKTVLYTEQQQVIVSGCVKQSQFGQSLCCNSYHVTTFLPNNRPGVVVECHHIVDSQNVDSHNVNSPHFWFCHHTQIYIME